MKYWEIIADNLSNAAWSWGCVSAIDSNGRTTWIADAHRDDGKRFVVRADEKLTALWNLKRRFGVVTNCRCYGTPDSKDAPLGHEHDLAYHASLPEQLARFLLRGLAHCKRTSAFDSSLL